jgi:hypothetical protein
MPRNSTARRSRLPALRVLSTVEVAEVEIGALHLEPSERRHI